MKQHHLRLLLLSLAVCGSSSVFAQADDLSYIFTARPKNTFSAALKIRTSGANVKFGNLGTVDYLPGVYQADANGVPLKDNNGALILAGYNFHDGRMRIDAKRPNETSSTDTSTVGTRTTTTTNTATPSSDGKRYLTSVTVVVVDTADPTQNSTTTTNTGDFLAYQAGQTRAWSYQDASQISNGTLDMHAYSSKSNGAEKEADSGSSGGFDLQFARELGAIGKKGQWGFALSIGVNDINAKTAGRISADLITQTAHFGLLGQTLPTAPYAGPSFTDFTLTDGTGTPTGTVNPTGLETTVPISDAPTLDTHTTPGAAIVDGNWKIKGAYYIMRLGPSFRYQLTKRISLFGNAGVAAGYVGSVFSATETLAFPANVPVLAVPDSNGNPAPIPPVIAFGEIRNRAFKVGYYGEINAEFWLSFRTGLFAGVVYEKLGDYSQTLGDRTAKVNIGGGLAFRIGIINRF